MTSHQKRFMGQKRLVLTQATSFSLKHVYHQARDLPLVLREKQKANPIFMSARKQSYVHQTYLLAGVCGDALR